MKLGIGSNAYARRYGWEEGLRRMKRHGYDYMDSQAFIDTETPLFALSGAQFDRHLKQEADRIHDAGIEIFQTHGPWRFPPQDHTEADRAERFEKMARSLHGTSVLSCPYMVIHPIMPYGAAGGDDVPRFFEINFDFFRRLCRVAEDENVVICLENMPFPALPMTTPAQILDFVKEMDTPWLRVCLDTGHSIVCGVQPADAVRLTGGDYLKTLHIHDNNSVSDWHWLPGEGIGNWPDFVAALTEIGYDGPLSLECAVGKDVPEDQREAREIALANFFPGLVG